jgi:hypothetical protein
VACWTVVAQYYLTRRGKGTKRMSLATAKVSDQRVTLINFVEMPCRVMVRAHTSIHTCVSITQFVTQI